MSKAGHSSIPEDLKITHDGYFRETFQTKRLAKAFLKKVLPENIGFTAVSMPLDKECLKNATGMGRIKQCLKRKSRILNRKKT